jgi:hypothetical protein
MKTTKDRYIILKAKIEMGNATSLEKYEAYLYEKVQK